MVNLLQYIAAGSEDTHIKIVERGEGGSAFDLSGHEGPILSIDISNRHILASSAGDGTIRIWNLKEKKEIKCFEGFEKIKTFNAAKSYGIQLQSYLT